MSYLKKTISPQIPKSGSPSQAMEENRKKTSLLKDGSWIRKEVAEDEPVDRDSNFGKGLLSKYKSNDTIDSAEPANITSPKTPTTPSSSVQALSKRFGTNQDDLNKSSTLPSSNLRNTTYSTKSTSSTLKSDAPNTTSISKTTVTDEPKSSTTTTTTITKGGTTTETILTTQTVSSSSDIKSPTRTGTLADRVFSDSSSKGKLSPLLSPSKPVTTDVKVTSNKGAENQTLDKLLFQTSETDTSNLDSNGSTTPTITKPSSSAENQLFDALLPKAMQTGYSSIDSNKSPSVTSPVSSTRTITSSFSSGDDLSSTRTTTSSTTNTKTSYSSYSSGDDLSSTRTTTSNTVSSKPSSYSSGDDLSSTRAITSNTISSKPSDNYSVTTTRKSYSSIPDSYDYTSGTSPTVYTSTSYKDSSRLSDPFDDSLVSKSSIKTVYSAPERTVQAKDLCSYCRKPMSSDPKMVLDEMKINCHANCFKCEVCSSPLGHLKAGDSMWIYRRTVHCERCFDITREKWRR